MTYAVGFFTLFGLVVVYMVFLALRAGPRQLSEADLARAVPVLRVSRNDDGNPWSELGKKTTADGIDLKFEHDDGPWARASMAVPGSRNRGSLAHALTVRLTEDYVTHHVHTRGHVFRVRLRGEAPVIGKDVRLLMHVNKDGSPRAATIENDDDSDAAVGGWIRIEWAEILRTT